jgi:murein DD-endopeptidase MepM/ murein hydrolase activator NlpD
MRPAFKRAARVLWAVYLLLIHAVLVYFFGERIVRTYVRLPSEAVTAVSDPTGQQAPPTPVVEPSFYPVINDTIANNQPSPQATIEPLPPPPGSLIIPVAGVRPEQLIDTFSQTRSEGRLHQGIDIPAPAGTSVLAAGDGEIVKFHDSNLGGVTIYQLSANRKYFYYYAHLQHRADDLKEGDTVKRRKVIGFVGDTGNAGAGNYHLHFSITTAIDPKRYWEGIAINPYPVLKGAATLQ